MPKRRIFPSLSALLTSPRGESPEGERTAGELTMNFSLGERGRSLPVIVP